MASITQQAAEEFFQKLLAEMSPEDEQYIMQLLAENAPASGPLREVVHNVLDEPIPQEMEKRLHKPLLPKAFQPRAPPRQKRGRRRQELLREFDPFPPQNIRRVANYQNEILDLYDEAIHGGGGGGRDSNGAAFYAMALHQRFGRKPHTKLFGKNSRERSHSVLHQARLLVSAAQH